MENDFFDLYAGQELLALEVGHNSVADWNVIVYDRKGRSISESKKVVHAQGCSRKEVFAKAYTMFAEWLCEERGGY